MIYGNTSKHPHSDFSTSQNQTMTLSKRAKEIENISTKDIVVKGGKDKLDVNQDVPIKPPTV